MINPRFHDDEPAAFVMPGDDIMCVDCDLRLKGYEGFRKGNCKAYPEPGHKPISILFHDDDCDYYEKDPNGPDE